MNWLTRICFCIVVITLMDHTICFSHNVDNPTFKVVGKVLDDASKEPLEYATVSAFLKEELITGSISNIEGRFELDLPKGSYTIIIEYIAYQNKIFESVDVDGTKPRMGLGKIYLIPDARTLEQVEVVEEKSQMQLSLDKKIYNVGKDINSKSGSADDLLDNIPSVNVDLDGNVSLRGSEDVRILIDGRPSGASGVRGANLLKSIQANQVDRVEVITNPSARYEAEGTSGILNIILKKNKKSGLNGSFDMSVGYPKLLGTGININYRKGKINWFSNLGLRYKNTPGSGFRDQRFTDGREPFQSIQNREHDRGSKSGSIKFGLDYHASPNDIITTYFEGEKADEDNDAQLIYRDFFTSNGVAVVSNRTDIEKEDESEIEYLLGYKHTFKENNKHVVSADFQYRNSSEDESSDFLNKIFDDSGSEVIEESKQRSQNEEGERIFLVKADYIYPISEEGKIEMGYRGNFRNVENTFMVEDYVEGQGWQTLESFNNILDYTENIHSAYVSTGDKVGKFSYLGGLRLEYSDITTDLLLSEENNPRTYTDLFPSIFLSYQLNKKNAVQVSYSRRIRRPRFFELNPFLTFSDSRNVFRGNPNLDPQYTNSYELGHVAYFEGLTITSNFYYRHSLGVIQRVISVNDDLTTTIQPENIGASDDFGLELTVSAEPVKRWKINADLNFFGFDLDGQFQDQIIETSDLSYNGRLTNQLKLKGLFSIQLRLQYRGSKETAQGQRNAFAFLDLGISRDILNKNGTLTLNARDLFNSRRRVATTYGEGFEIDSEFQWRSRQISLNFNYRLNRKKSKGGKKNRNKEGEEDF